MKTKYWNMDRSLKLILIIVEISKVKKTYKHMRGLFQSSQYIANSLPPSSKLSMKLNISSTLSFHSLFVLPPPSPSFLFLPCPTPFIFRSRSLYMRIEAHFFRASVSFIRASCDRFCACVAATSVSETSVRSLDSGSAIKVSICRRISG